MKFSPTKFQFITDARRGWKLDHENLAQMGKTAKYSSLEIFRLYSILHIHLTRTRARARVHVISHNTDKTIGTYM